MSDDDFVTETTLIGSTSTEFSQLRDDDNNAGFLFSQDIYFTNNAILYAPDISFTIDGNVINTNMDKPYFWDITSRLLEEDIYNALPDVRFDTKKKDLDKKYQVEEQQGSYVRETQYILKVVQIILKAFIIKHQTFLHIIQQI